MKKNLLKRVFTTEDKKPGEISVIICRDICTRHLANLYENHLNGKHNAMLSLAIRLDETGKIEILDIFSTSNLTAENTHDALILGSHEVWRQDGR